MDFNAIINNFIDVVKNKYLLFTGRARRREYWLFCLVTVVISLAVTILSYIFTALRLTPITVILTIINYLISLALLLPGLALSVRRLHDTGKDWPYLFLALIPFVGAIILLVFMVQDSAPGDNQFGPNPKA